MKVAGIDSSTQSTKVVIVEDGEIIRTGRSFHPEGTEIDPYCWWEALERAILDAGGIKDCVAVSIAGQQHGLICLDKNGEVLRDALLWNDTRSAQSANDLIAERSVEFWLKSCGSAPVSSLTVAKLRWVADNESELVNKIAAICLPHDWLTWKLRGEKDIHTLTTDRSDASGTGYLDYCTGSYRYDLLSIALRITETHARSIVLPRIVEPFSCVGKVSSKFGMAKIAPGCGDNAAAALSFGLVPGQALVSIGTSGVVSCVSENPILNYQSEVSRFMDATGKWLQLTCTLNGSKIIDYIRNILNVDYSEFDELVCQSRPNSLVLVPYFDGERTPNLPMSTATLYGMTPESMNRPAIARSGVEGLCCLLRNALEVLQQGGSVIECVFLVGGGAKSPVVRQFLANILAMPVEVPEPKEYVALGAAWQAMRMLDPTVHVWDVEKQLYVPQSDYGAWEKYQIHNL